MNNDRQLYIDNIRLMVIILVVLQHLALTYGGMTGIWYYVEPVEMGIIQTFIFGTLIVYSQAFFMGLLFLVAGYFVPESYDKKGFGKFIKDRFVRLGFPTILNLYIISPVVIFGLAGYRRIGPDGYRSFFDMYRRYVTSSYFFSGLGVLWFAFALLIFSVIYSLFRKLKTVETKTYQKEFPGLSKIILLTLFIAICTFLVRIVHPIDSVTAGMRLGHFSQYVIFFIIGIYCKYNGWLENISYKLGKACLFSGVTFGLVLLIVILYFGGATNGDMGPLSGGLTWQSAVFSLWESYIAVAMSVGLIALFKKRCNKQNQLIRTLSRNAFAVYVFHTPIIVAISLLFAPVNLIPVVKFVIVSTVAIPACFLFCNFIVLRIPVFKRIFV